MLKLVEPHGEILGAIVIPDRAMMTFIRDKVLIFYPMTPVETSFRVAPPDFVKVRRILIVPAHSQDDAVMLMEGSLYDFERIAGCFFIPGYALTMKER